VTRHVALLGSINVGGNRLKMADLTAAMEGAGFASVATVVASGNVLFDHPGVADAALESRIAALVEDRLAIATFAAVRTRAQIEAALAQSPFAGIGQDNLVHVHFLQCQPDAAAFDRLMTDHAGRGPERLAPGTRCLHIDFVDGAGNSRLTGDYIARRLGCRGTARNIRSLRRIVQAMG